MATLISHDGRELVTVVPDVVLLELVANGTTTNTVKARTPSQPMALLIFFRLRFLLRLPDGAVLIRRCGICRHLF
jgi:hypothetical protein